MTATTTTVPRVLIEDWFPVAELGIESRRERAAASALPPLSFLHVWWARRPLVASAAVVLAGVMPTWSPELADEFPEALELADEQSYHRWLLHLVGVWGDPVTAQRIIAAANESGTKLKGNGYGYKQAFRNAVPREDIDLLHRVLVRTWGELPLIADPTAGGGSIPFTAARLGLPTYANDLNGVAASVLRAGVQIPAREGLDLEPHLKKWGQELVGRVASSLKEYFPRQSGESIIAYVYANAVRCPRTGHLVPLMTDKWLRKEKGKEAAVRLIVEDEAGKPLNAPEFAVVLGSSVDKSDAAKGTVGRGSAVSPYDSLVIESDYIKAEAQAGRMTQVLYAIAIRTASGDRTFRAPTQADLDSIRLANHHFEDLKSEWESSGILPIEDFPAGNDLRPRKYGMTRWVDFFTPRQALVHGTFAREFLRIIPEVTEALGDLANDVLFELALMQGKALNWNSRMSSWDVSRQKMRSVFDRHDFAFKWTFAEFEGATALYQWCLDQLLDAYGGIAALLDETGKSLTGNDGRIERPVQVTQGSATSLNSVETGSVAHLCIDPPYYDNVMYAELADYFYVWEKRTLGRLVPEYFLDHLTDKENEAVANPARFETMGKRKKELADLDYETKMTAIFSECGRVLRDDGVLSVMFTHKRAEAWDTLGMSLLQSGFTVETSWPVNTEQEQSLHQANMNSAASTIMLVCRKRESDASARVFIDDIESEVRGATRNAAERFRDFGIEGVDLMLSTYGPALSVIASHWPVYSSEADESGRARLLRPDEALAIAREEVVRLTRQRIIGHDVQIDNHSDFVLIAWETFKAYEFSFDEARRLALTVGALDIDELARAKVLDKKSGTVRMNQPKDRIRRGADDSSTGVRIDASKFEYMNDALDTVLYVAEVDGMGSAKSFMDRLGLTEDQRFLAYVQGLVNAMPRMKVKGEWIVPEAGLLDTLVTAYLPEITLPAEVEEPVESVEEQTLFD